MIVRPGGKNRLSLARKLIADPRRLPELQVF
jgi:hypothetical protein